MTSGNSETFGKVGRIIPDILKITTVKEPVWLPLGQRASFVLEGDVDHPWDGSGRSGDLHGSVCNEIPVSQNAAKVHLEARKEVLPDDNHLLATLEPALCEGEGLDDWALHKQLVMGGVIPILWGARAGRPTSRTLTTMLAEKHTFNEIVTDENIKDVFNQNSQRLSRIIEAIKMKPSIVHTCCYGRICFG